jgi:hypothetical protein
MIDVKDSQGKIVFSFDPKTKQRIDAQRPNNEKAVIYKRKPCDCHKKEGGLDQSIG